MTSTSRGQSLVHHNETTYEAKFRAQSSQMPYENLQKRKTHLKLNLNYCTNIEEVPCMTAKLTYLLENQIDMEKEYPYSRNIDIT